MKIQYASDLHLEFPENKEFLLNNPLIPQGDILILAGDVMPFKQMDEYQWFWDYCSKNFAFTYWVPGNHEYYHSDINDNIGEMHQSIGENVFLVNNTWVNHGSVKQIL